VPYQLSDVEILMKDPHVAQWYRDLSSTGVSPDAYLEGLHRISRHSDAHPKEFLQMSPAHRQKLIDRFRKEQEALGHDARIAIEALHHWIRHNEAK
jgi:hypothetical protein